MKKTLITFGSFTTLSSIIQAGTILSSVDHTGFSTTDPAYFSDGFSDYLGVVDTGGTTINGGSGFSSSLTVAEGDLVGEDLDGEGGSITYSTTFTIALPGDACAGTGLTDIAFSMGIVGGTGAWDDADNVTVSFTVGGTLIDTRVWTNNDTADAFNGDLWEDTTNDGKGDTLQPTVNFADPGGATIASASVTVSVTANAGNEEFAFSAPSLTANYLAEPIPEPSTALLGGLALLGLIRRRR